MIGCFSQIERRQWKLAQGRSIIHKGAGGIPTNLLRSAKVADSLGLHWFKKDLRPS